LLIGTAIAFFSGRLAKSTELIEKANGQKFMTKAPKIVLPPISDAKSDQPAPQGRIVHGYDSDELCREDFELDSPSIRGHLPEAGKSQTEISVDAVRVAISRS